MAPPEDFGRRIRYWILLALPVAAFTFLAATGRWQAYWHQFRRPLTTPDAALDDSSFVTAIIWVLSTLPLMFTAWQLGRRHTAARRNHYELLVGLREVFRVAFGRGASDHASESFTRPPRDNVRTAALLGLGVAILVPVFFMSFLPTLRTLPGAIWLGGAGVLMGGITFFQRRASAYLVDEPPYFDLFRQYRLLNPARYEPAGRAFVRAQIALAIMLPIWWLGGASIAFL